MPTSPERMPWERQPGESVPAFAAFALYRDLGDARSYQRVSQELTKSLTLVKRWGSREGWRVRAAAWDRHLDLRKQEKQIETIQAIAQRLAVEAMRLQEIGVEALQGVDPRELTPSQILSFIIRAAQLERLARGQPGSISASARCADAGCGDAAPRAVEDPVLRTGAGAVDLHVRPAQAAVPIAS